MNYRFFDMNYRLWGYACTPTPCYNVISAEEKQAPPPEAFVFHALINEHAPDEGGQKVRSTGMRVI